MEAMRQKARIMVLRVFTWILFKAKIIKNIKHPA